MLSAPDVLVLARRSTGISQAELARRLGRPRSTIARWESGRMDPSYGAVTAAINACGLAASVELAAPDDSHVGQVGDLLRLRPLERVRRLAGGRVLGQLLELARHGPPGVLFGDVAAVLAGWPLRLPNDAALELCAEGPSTGEQVVVHPPGTRGLSDLSADSEPVQLGERLNVRIASPLDLLRIERARGRAEQAGALLAVLEHRRRWPDGPPARREYTEDQAAAAIESWLTAT